MSSQVSDRYRPQHQQQRHQHQQHQQHSEFFNSNSNGNGNRTYSTERNNGSRNSAPNGNSNNSGNGNGGNKFTYKSLVQPQQQTNNMSISPPLSVASSGSSTASGTKSNSNRNSKSYNGNTMQSMNTHRNNGNTNIPTTPTIQQSHNAYFPSQNISFFHSTTANVGVQPIFSSAISPTAQSQHSSLPMGLYVQHNGNGLTYHANNNYNYHNRNYHGNKKNWQFHNKSKSSKMNSNYSSSNSSTASSTHSSTGKSDSISKTANQSTQLRNDDATQPSAPASKPSKSSLKKSKSTEKMPVKKTAHKSTQVESPLPSGPKIISLSDSETCNSKPKQHHQQQLPLNDYFRPEKSKAASSPVINTQSASSSLSSGNNSPNRTHSFLSAIDNDTLKKSNILSDQRSVSYEKPAPNNGIETTLFGFPQQRATINTTATTINNTNNSNNNMQIAFKSLFNRMRYIDQSTMHQLSDTNPRINTLMGTINGHNLSPSRIKTNFATHVPQKNQR